MVLVSSCLAGIPCRFDKTAKPNDEVIELVKSGKAQAACPECLAGMKRPSPPSEIRGGTGEDVLAGRAFVYNKEGKDISDDFIKGARKFLALAQKINAEYVMLKAKSPSCGVTEVYDGTFSGKTIPGGGVTAALLKQNGIQVVEVP